MKTKKTIAILALVIIAIAGGVFFFVNIYNTPTPPTAPQAVLECEYHSANNSLTIHHVKGETFSTSSFETVALEVYAFPDTKERPNEPTATIDLPFSPGDTVTITEVNRSDRMLVIWAEKSHSEIVENCSDQLGES